MVNDMDKLAAQVKKDLIRTFFWVAIAMSVGAGIFCWAW